MSDFQDEQGLGELPADLYAQYVEQFKPNSSPISGVAASAPPNLSSDSPKYPVSVDSVFQTLPINAVDFIVTGGEFVGSDSSTISGIAGVSTLSFITDSSHVTVLKKLKWGVSPRRYFLNWAALSTPLGLLTVSVGGIVVSSLSGLAVADSGDLDVNIIVGLSTKVDIVLDFRNTYGTIAGTNYGTVIFESKCFTTAQGYSLLSRGLPSNFEIAS